MRKLLVVLSALLLVAFAVPAFASDFSWSGEFTYGVSTVFDPAKDQDAYGKLELDVSAAVDDYNTVAIEFDAESLFAVNAAYFKLTSDLGAALDLPIDLSLTSGYFGSGTQEYAAVTGWSIEDVAVGGTTLDGGFQFSFGFGSANLDIAFSVAQGTGGQDILVDFYMPDVSGAQVELFYDIVNNDDFKGAFGLDGTYGVGPATIAAGFEYDTVAETWAYGLGVSAEVSMTTIGVSLDGNDTDALDSLGIDLNIAPADNYGIDVGVLLSFASGADTFQCADISAYYNVGGATLRAGYDVTSVGEAYNAPVALTDGGLYFSTDIDF